MALLEINTNPSRRDLAWFGVVLLAFLGIVGAIAWRATGSAVVGRVIWSAAVAAFVVYYLAPRVRRPMFVAWMYAAYPIGYVVSHVLLAIIYFGLLTPVGLLMRAIGHDPMTRRFDRAAPTYWIAKERPPDVRTYFRQF